MSCGIMAYKIDNAIVKKDVTGKLTLIDPDNVFADEDAFIAVKSDDLITIQLLINGIMKNDCKTWKELGSIPDNEPLKSLFVRLGYSREDIAKLLKERQPECLIIFLTAHPQYAIDAFELEIFRYIPKNELETRFEKYLNEAVSQISKLDEQSYIIEKKGYIEKRGENGPYTHMTLQ